jgi:hypothetical protein
MNHHRRPWNRSSNSYDVLTWTGIIADRAPDIRHGFRRWTVEYDTKCSLFIVLDHEDHGSIEVRVAKVWGGDEKVAL